MEILKQDRNHPVDVALQVAIIYAVTHNFLEDVEVGDIAAFEQGLFEAMEEKHQDIIDAIHQTGDLSKENAAKLEEAIGQFKASFLNAR